MIGNKEHWEYVGGLEKKLIQIEDIIKEFFGTPANKSLFTDTSECYVALGKIKEVMEISVITSERSDKK